ncbi:MAG: xanthine dehydrogenase family protein molybdopterin-binding subunit [Gammaproteobacteria bacterium]|nr:xanthine dehydrogenase family protein molybdopterin-binding subunit [Gammaproteobacteria bacterium]
MLSWVRPDPRQALLPADEAILQPNAWLQIRPDGAIILQIDKIEMGQGVTTGYVTLLAEELDVAPGQVTTQIAPVHPLFQDPAQLTGESRSMVARWLPVRETGARARQMLLAAAARRWQTDITTLDTDGAGTVIDGRGNSLRYADLANEAATLPVPARVELRTPAQYRWIGREVPRPDIPAKVLAQARYGIDTQLPDLKVAIVLRPAQLQAVLRSHDAAAARSMAGVVDIFPIHSGIAVVADNFWQAQQAAAAIRAEWEPGPLAGVSSESIRAGQGRQLDTQSGLRIRDDGAAEAAFKGAARVVEAEYWVPYLAHATLEPMNATVWFHDGGCEAWVPNQSPDIARQLICDVTDLPRAAVTVHSTLVGGGFGRRAIMDYVTEAAEIGRRFEHPVKLVWSREDDMRHGVFREATLHRLRGGLDASGQPVAWQHRLIAASLNRLIFPLTAALMAPEWMPKALVRGITDAAVPVFDRLVGSYAAREGANSMAYAIPNVQVDLAEWNPGVPTGIWRSVSHSYTSFVIESFIDELAHAADEDPAAFRRRYLATSPRHLAALELVLAQSGWNESLPAGRYRGLAIQEAFNTVVAQVAEISIAGDRTIRVHRVTCAVDCGTAINPDVVRQQMEGGILFGLSAALYGEITIEDGAVRESNFHDYRLLRIADAPAIDVHIVPSEEPPSGVGEPGVPPIAPAVANAVFAATGQRLRTLPLRLAVASS